MRARTSINQCYQTMWQTWSDFVGRMLRFNKVTHLEKTQLHHTLRDKELLLRRILVLFVIKYFHSSSLKQESLSSNSGIYHENHCVCPQGKKGERPFTLLWYMWLCRLQVSGVAGFLADSKSKKFRELAASWAPRCVKLPCAASNIYLGYNRTQMFGFGTSNNFCVHLSTWWTELWVSPRKLWQLVACWLLPCSSGEPSPL